MKFEGATMRDALAKVKAELGDQAVIISTRQVRRGLLGSAVEISAAIDTDEADPPPPPTMTGPTTGGPLPPPSAPPRNDQELEKLIAPVRSELRSLRALVRTSGDNRGTTELRSELAALRKLVEDLAARPAPITQATIPAPILRGRATTQRDRPPHPLDPSRVDRFRSAAKQGSESPYGEGPPCGDTPLTAPSNASAVMLVGPTGAGKTTTIAKIAARAALIDGRRVGLITLDNYRVGGIEQIRMFADLIGIPVAVAESPAQLGELLDPHHQLTLIDTAGRSPRDIAAIAELAGHIAGLELEVHLVIPAGSSPAQIDELVSRYSGLGPSRLLFTKLDECDRAPELAMAPTRTGLPITWVTTGQAVPEDIEQPTPARVLELASGGLSAPHPRSHRAA
jgi:flagellar biosynthesis protein FlhF